MPNTNITKITLFVILALGGSMSLACGSLASNGAAQSSEKADFGFPARVGTLRSPALKEASGIAASKCQPNVYWTHNDSGDDALLYAIDGAGAQLGVWRVNGARNKDWEDIAVFKDGAGKCYVLIGDIGNNELEKGELSVYRVVEPSVGDEAAVAPKGSPQETSPAEVMNYEYPDARRNAETLLVHPSSGDIYVLSKSKKEPVSVYKLKPDISGAKQRALKVAEFALPAVPNGFLTGGDISPDGGRVVLCDYVYGYELTLPVLAANFDDIWKQQALRFDLGDRKVGEAVSFTSNGDAVIAISEEVNTPIYLVKRK
jgi:hypothetical protein